MVADGMKIGLAVDQDAFVPIGHLAIDLLECGQTAHGISVEIACQAVLVIRIVP